MSEASPSDREARLEQVLAEYLQAAEAGPPPDREAFLARHTDLAEELLSFFADRDHFEQVAGQPVPPEPACPMAATAPLKPTAADPRLGTIRYFGDYELLAEIARGGMGVVFRARQVSLHRPVAVKMILAGQLASPEEVERFHREAQTAANLDHPYIVPIYEVGEHEGQHYFSMKLIEGGDLGRQREQFRNDFPRIARLLASVARAVQHAHERGLLHRDLKPANILLDAQGQPHVTDFGLARRVEDPAGRTQSGAIVGTPAYMAPEQAAGKNHELTPAADVHALGAILYELLTGRPPYQAETPVDVLVKVIGDEPTPPRKLNAKVPRDLETICLKCLHNEPKRRYASTQALVEDLEAWLEGQPITARPVRKLEGLGRWARRHPEQAFWRGIAIAALLGAVGYAIVWGIEQYCEAQAERARQILAAQRERNEQQLREARAARDKGLQLVEAGELEPGMLWLARALELAPDDASDLQQSVCPTLAGLMSRLRARVIQPEHRLESVTWSTDGRWLTTQEGGWWLQLGRTPERRALLLDTATMKPRSAPITKPRTIWTTRFQKGSAELCFGERKQSAALFAREDQADRHQGPIIAVDLSPDGKILLTGSVDKTARLWDAKTGQPIGSPLSFPNWVERVEFSPDGKAFLTVESNWLEGVSDSLEGSHQLWNTATRKRIGKSLPNKFNNGGWFSPDGKYFLTNNTKDVLQLVDLVSGEFRSSPFDHPNAWVEAFSLSGNVIITRDYQKVRIWNMDEGKALRGPFTVKSGSRFAIDPKGEKLAVWKDGSLESLEVKDLGNDKTLWKPKVKKGEQSPSIRQVVFSPDGQLLLVRTEDTLFLWNATTGAAQVEPQRGHRGIATFSSDGKTLLLEEFVSPPRNLWDARTGKPFLFDAEGWDLVAATNDGKLALLRSQDALQLWDMTANRPAGKAIPCSARDQVIFDAIGANVVTGEYTSSIRLWDLRSGKLLWSQPRKSWWAQFSPYSRLVFVIGAGHGHVLDIATGKLLLREDMSWGGCIFCPGGKLVLLMKDGEVFRFWNVATGKAVGEKFRSTANYSGIQISADGQFCLHYSDAKTLVLRNTVTGRKTWERPLPLMLDPGTGYVFPGDYRLPWSFSPDSRRFVAGSVDLDAEARADALDMLLHCMILLQGPSRLKPSLVRGKAQVWDVATGQPVGKPLQHAKPVYAVAFSPDGKRVLTGSEDKTARLWDADTGNTLATLNHPHWVVFVEFSPDGKTIHTMTIDGVHRLWDAEPLHNHYSNEALILWAQVHSRKELDDNGTVRELDEAAVQARRRRLQELGGPLVP